MIRQLCIAGLLCAAAILDSNNHSILAQNVGNAKQVLVNHETTLTWPLPDGWRNHPVQFEVKAGDRVLGKGFAKVSTVDDVDSLSVNVLIESTRLTSISECQITLKCTEHWFPSPIILFPEHPFEDHREMLETLGIQLLDADGKTKTVFDVHQIPYANLKSIEDLDPKPGSLLIIGEGHEYNEKFSKLLVEASKQDVNVLCLSPLGTELSFAIEDQLVVLQQSTSQNSFGINWKTSLAATKFWQPRYCDGKLTLATEAKNSGWPWIKLQSTKHKLTDQTEKVTKSPSSLIVCGFPIILKHDEAPAARHFLAKLLIERVKGDAIQAN